MAAFFQVYAELNEQLQLLAFVPADQEDILSALVADVLNIPGLRSSLLPPMECRARTVDGASAFAKIRGPWIDSRFRAIRVFRITHHVPLKSILQEAYLS